MSKLKGLLLLLTSVQFLISMEVHVHFLYRNYHIGGIFCGEKFLRISRFRKNYTQETKNYMVCTLFLTDSQKFNPTKYTTYTVFLFLHVIIVLLLLILIILIL